MALTEKLMSYREMLERHAKINMVDVIPDESDHDLREKILDAVKPKPFIPNEDFGFMTANKGWERIANDVFIGSSVGTTSTANPNANQHTMVCPICEDRERKGLKTMTKEFEKMVNEYDADFQKEILQKTQTRVHDLHAELTETHLNHEKYQDVISMLADELSAVLKEQVKEKNHPFSIEQDCLKQVNQKIAVMIDSVMRPKKVDIPDSIGFNGKFDSERNLNELKVFAKIKEEFNKHTNTVPMGGPSSPPEQIVGDPNINPIKFDMPIRIWGQKTLESTNPLWSISKHHWYAPAGLRRGNMKAIFTGNNGKSKLPGGDAIKFTPEAYYRKHTIRKGENPKGSPADPDISFKVLKNRKQNPCGEVYLRREDDNFLDDL